MYVDELKVAYCKRWVKGTPLVAERLDGPAQAGALLAAILGCEVVEVFGLVCLTLRNRVVAYHELSRGTIDATLAHPRDVLRAALLSNAASVVVAHNHPSGDPTPSANDFALTVRLSAAAEIVGVELTDHIIVTSDGSYYSFRESGRL